MAITPRTKKLLENYVRKQVRKSLMENQEPSKTYLLKSVDVEIHEDDYEQGELGHVNSWSENIGKQFKTKQELIAYISKNYVYGATESDFEYEPDNDTLYTDSLVDEDNSQATDSQKAQWKQGKLKLYNAHYMFDVEVFTKTKADF